MLNGGNATAWIRFKNTGATPAYKVMGWMMFYRMPSNANPFAEVRVPSNESVVSPEGNSNLSGTIAITENQLREIEAGTESLFVWGRIEYVDVFKIPWFFSFKAKMTGPPESTVMDGVRTPGWGLQAIENGIEAN